MSCGRAAVPSRHYLKAPPKNRAAATPTIPNPPATSAVVVPDFEAAGTAGAAFGAGVVAGAPPGTKTGTGMSSCGGLKAFGF